MTTAINLPTPAEIRRQIEQKQTELQLLRKLLSASNKAAAVLALSGDNRGMLSPGLAALYGIGTRTLVQAVKTVWRFSSDFMFQVGHSEQGNLKSRTVISSEGGPRTNPYVFIEYGVAMLSAMFSGKRAVEVSVLIIRTVVRLRQMLAGNAELARKVEDLKRQSAEQGQRIEAIVLAIWDLMAEPNEEPEKSKIGYETERKAKARRI
jgi:hypothetical protein